jgi:release factor glutamine methyltransferase
LRPGVAVDLDRVVARLRAAGCVRAEDEAAALLGAARTPGELESLVARRIVGEPLEHVVGWADFAGIPVHVAAGVFVPRHRSEHLVDVAASLLHERTAAARPPPRSGTIVLDLCAGTGALGLALHRVAGPFDLYAADLDPLAVACAADNVAPVGGVALLGDLFDPVPAQLRGRIDLIVANAPYVPTSVLDLLPHEAREHESPLALDGGPDGLAVHARLLAEAPDWLAARGVVLVEVAEDQVPAALSLVTAAGMTGQAVPAPDDPDTVAIIGRHPNHSASETRPAAEATSTAERTPTGVCTRE